MSERRHPSRPLRYYFPRRSDDESSDGTEVTLNPVLSDAGPSYKSNMDVRFGPNRVEAIGDIRKLDGADREADIVLKDGTAIEAKANTVSDINEQLSNIRDYQKLSSSEEANAILVANNPSEATTGPVNGVDNGYIKLQIP